MIRRCLLLVLAVVVLLGGGPGAGPARADAGDQYFPQTGFTVPARFLAYWNAHGGLAIFGYPISAARTEDGYLVQYFERNRFEYHPEHAGTPYEVLLGLLGTVATLERAFPPVAELTTTPGHVYFAPTGHNLHGGFLDFWRSHGGLAVFGYPISEEFPEQSATNGKIYTVQYFQRNRFEYHPENAGTPYVVEMGLLGRDYLARLGPNNGPPAGGPFPGYSAAPPAGYPPAPAGPFLQGPHGAYGVIVHMYYQDHRRILDAVQDVGFTWIKQQVQWEDIEGTPGAYAWGELDSIVADTAARGIHILLSVVKPPAWATGGGTGFPSDPQYLTRFLTALAAHYRGHVQAYEIWNEQNLFVESRDLDPGHYAALLKAGYLGVKAGDAGAIVLSGALTPTGIYDPQRAVEDTWYLDRLYQWNNGAIRQYYDVLGSHPYGYNNPPDTMWPDNPSHATGFTTHGQFYFRRVEQQRQVMEKYGEGGKQVWLTEFGWCSDARAGGYDECAQTGLDQQAGYTVWATLRARAYYPWMGVMFLWNLNFSTFQPGYAGPSLFSILNADWSPRPVYTALKTLPKP